jgi:hypothetical protein
MTVVMSDWGESTGSRRRVARRAIVLTAELIALRLSWPCLVLDISPIGAGVRLSGTERLQVGASSSLRLREFGSIASEVRRLDPAFVGLMFRRQDERDAEMRRWLELLFAR